MFSSIPASLNLFDSANVPCNRNHVLRLFGTYIGDINQSHTNENEGCKEGDLVHRYVHPLNRLIHIPLLHSIPAIPVVSHSFSLRSTHVLLSQAQITAASENNTVSKLAIRLNEDTYGSCEAAHAWTIRRNYMVFLGRKILRSIPVSLFSKC